MKNTIHGLLLCALAPLIGCGEEEQESKLIAELTPAEVEQACRGLEDTIDAFSSAAAEASCVLVALQSPECPLLRPRCDKTTPEALEGDLVTSSPFGFELFPPYECKPRQRDPVLDGTCEATVRELEECYGGLAKSAEQLMRQVRCSTDFADIPALETPSVCGKVSDDCTIMLGIREREPPLM